jgi:hypothetical protein
MLGDGRFQVIDDLAGALAAARENGGFGLDRAGSPGFGHIAGFLTAVVLQALLGVTLFVVFRRRGWL